MSYTVLLLGLLLMGAVSGQSTTAASSSANVEAAVKVEPKNKDGGSNDTSNMKVLKTSESMDKFSFTEADAKSLKPQVPTEPDRDSIKENDEADELVIFETLLNAGKEIPEGEVVTITKDKDDDGNNDDDDDDDGDDDDDDDDEDGVDEDISSDSNKSRLASTASGIPIRRQGDLDPDFVKKGNDNVDFPQSRQDTNNPNQFVPPYIASRDQIVPSDATVDNSPLLQLTQGGYQRPYQRRVQINGQRPRIRSGSASQQSETVERPVGTQNTGEQRGQPQITPQVTYASAYPPRLDYGGVPVFRHPLDPSGSFINTNGPMPNTVQNGYFNAQTALYPDFTSNFQSQFTPSTDGFSGVSRDPNSFSQYQVPPMANPGMLFQTPTQFSQPQPMAGDFQRPVHNLFQPAGFSPYASVNNVEGTPRPDYSAYFRSSSPMSSPQFQVNPNFYGTLPSGSPSSVNNPTINLLPGYPSTGDGSPFSSRFLRYPIVGNHIPVQNTDQQVQKQQQDSESGPGDQKTKDSEQINALPNKEDPTSVPFGARIQRQNDSPDQNDFVEPRDVYIRYPMTEAGYATEESLPIQNTTEKDTRNNVASQRLAFPFFTAPRPYPGFSSPDPYRNALNMLQQGYPTDNISTKSEDSNSTQENAAEQFARNIQFPFNQGPAQSSSPVFNGGFPDMNRDPSDLQRASFYAAPGTDGVRNPFDQLQVFPDRNYQYPAPESARNAAESNITPNCAQETNASLCFEDPEYPRRELLYALNSDSFLLERLVMPDQQLEGIPLVEQKTSESPESQDNYICKSDLKYGMPLRAKNIKGTWKVIVNIERAIGGGKFIQPVRLEVCRQADEPCSFTTEIKTACVQKYSLQRLLSWSAEKGVHNDVYKLPVACSCQVVDAKV